MSGMYTCTLCGGSMHAPAMLITDFVTTQRIAQHLACCDYCRDHLRVALDSAGQSAKGDRRAREATAAEKARLLALTLSEQEALEASQPIQGDQAQADIEPP